MLLLYSRMMQYPPWVRFYRTGNIAGLSIMPISFLYFRIVLRRKVFRPIYLLHFLPALLFIIDYFPVYLLSGSAKIAMAKADLMLDDRGSKTPNGWISPQIPWDLVRSWQIAIYWMLQVQMLYATTIVADAKKLFRENKSLLRWLIMLCCVQILYFVPYFINSVFGSNAGNYVAIYTTIAIGNIFLILILLFQPEILYGLKGLLIIHPRMGIHNVDQFTGQDSSFSTGNSIDGAAKLTFQGEVKFTFDEDKPKSTEYLPKEKLDLLMKKIDEVLADHQVYLQKGYSLQDFSIATGYPSYLLSAFINQVHKQRFNEYINSYRIDYACELIKSGSIKMLTLETLAEQCGFNNRNSFTAAFKKKLGLTPSAFARKVDQES